MTKHSEKVQNEIFVTKEMKEYGNFKLKEGKTQALKDFMKTLDYIEENAFKWFDNIEFSENMERIKSQLEGKE